MNTFISVKKYLIIYYYRRARIQKYIKLKELKWQGPLLLMIIVCSAYYTKYIPNINTIAYWGINVISLALAVAYSVANNYNFIKSGLRKIKNKIGNR